MGNQQDAGVGPNFEIAQQKGLVIRVPKFTVCVGEANYYLSVENPAGAAGAVDGTVVPFGHMSHVVMGAKMYAALFNPFAKLPEDADDAAMDKALDTAMAVPVPVYVLGSAGLAQVEEVEIEGESDDEPDDSAVEFVDDEPTETDDDDEIETEKEN